MPELAKCNPCPHGWKRWSSRRDAEGEATITSVWWQNPADWKADRPGCNPRIFDDDEYLPCGCLASKDGAVEMVHVERKYGQERQQRNGG